MLVMSWNTLHGGYDDADSNRFALQVEVIAEVYPDVLLLQEARNFEADANRRLYQTERALGMRGYLALAPHTGQNTALFTRPGVEPVSFTGDSVHFHHAAALATLQIPGFALPVTFASVHLCPVGVPLRLVEVANFIPSAAPDRLTLIAGDFNSISPHDVEPQWGTLSSHHRARYTEPDGKRADRRVLETLEGAGYVDLAYHLGGHETPTVPSAAFPDSEFVAFRADYFLASAALANYVTSYTVIRNDKTDRASDHYPIIADFTPPRAQHE